MVRFYLSSIFLKESPLIAAMDDFNTNQPEGCVLSGLHGKMLTADKG
jgi:hypothetical protein